MQEGRWHWKEESTGREVVPRGRERSTHVGDRNCRRNRRERTRGKAVTTWSGVTTGTLKGDAPARSSCVCGTRLI
jgi:hypothetical protein